MLPRDAAATQALPSWGNGKARLVHGRHGSPDRHNVRCHLHAAGYGPAACHRRAGNEDEAAGRHTAGLVGSPSGRRGRRTPTRLDETVIDRDGSGQFHISLLVNGQDTSFLVDTGADTVALTVEDAERLGLDVEPANFQPIVQTASGTGNGALVTIDRLDIGGDELHDVPAIVAEGLRQNLLGQSVLRRLGNVQLVGDRMTIHHN